MKRYQLISLKDNKLLNESDSYSFILYSANRYKRMEVDFQIIDRYSQEVKETFKGVIL